MVHAESRRAAAPAIVLAATLGLAAACWAAAIDVPLALALVGLGFVIIIAPSLVPGLTPPPMLTTRNKKEGDRQ